MLTKLKQIFNSYYIIINAEVITNTIMTKETKQIILYLEATK